MNNREIPEVLQSPSGDLFRRPTRGLRPERLKDTPKIAHQCPSGLGDLQRLNDDHVHRGSKDADIQDSCRPHNVSNPHPRISFDGGGRQCQRVAPANGSIRSYFGRWLPMEPDIEHDAGIDCFRTTAAPSSRPYKNIISLDYLETIDDRLTRSKKVVRDLLKDPKSAHWLNGSMFGDGDEGQLQQWHGRDRDRKRAKHTQWLEFIARVGEILFWILHITAALGYVLVRNSSGPKGHPMVELYARKVLLGGVLACLGGYYTLVKMLSVSAASAFTATPIFFTIVVLLIRAT
ncbi:MAG: hypothetical protein Q9178_007253 [Gyalolechia marmorata]